MALSFESPREQPEPPRKTMTVPAHDSPFAPSSTMSTVPSSTVRSRLEERQLEFKPTLRFYLAFGTLSVITMMVALDGTSLSVALPVRCPSPLLAFYTN